MIINIDEHIRCKYTLIMYFNIFCVYKPIPSRGVDVYFMTESAGGIE